MLFSHNKWQEGTFWVADPNDSVRLFEPCDECKEAIDTPLLEDFDWREADLCEQCSNDLEITCAIDDLKAGRIDVLDP